MHRRDSVLAVERRSWSGSQGLRRLVPEPHAGEGPDGVALVLGEPRDDGDVTPAVVVFARDGDVGASRAAGTSPGYRRGVTWEPGHEEIEKLVASGRLQQIVPDMRVATRLLDEAGRHLDSARLTGDDDPSGAYVLAYDALRKSALALLMAQGLRATTRGGHLAVQEAVLAQFVDRAPVFKSFNRIRQTRHSFEYPDSESPEPAAEDVADVISVAARARSIAQEILRSADMPRWE